MDIPMENSPQPTSSDVPHNEQIPQLPDLPESQNVPSLHKSTRSATEHSSPINTSTPKIVAGILLLFGILFSPIPYYESHQQLCKECAPDLVCPPCPGPGWRVTASLAQYGFALATRSSRATTGLTQASIEPAISPNQTTQAPQKTYTSPDGRLSFRYPSNIELKMINSLPTLHHEIPFANSGDCDMSPSTPQTMLTDFDLSFEIKKNTSTPTDYSDGSYTAGTLQGSYRISGAEGCGITEYFFPIGSDLLVITRKNIQALSGISTLWDTKKILHIPGVIAKDTAQKMFDQILSTILVSSSEIKPTTIATWKYYANELYRYAIQYPAMLEMTDSNSFVQFRTQKNNMITMSATKTSYATITEYLTDLDKQSQTAWEGKPTVSITSTKKTKINEFSVVEREEHMLAADLTRTVTYFKIGSYIIAYSFIAAPGNEKTEDMKIYFAMRQTLKSISQPPAHTSPTCIPRPACLDTNPRCMMPETENMCPAKLKPTAVSQTSLFCGGIAGKLCPSGYTCKYDGTYPDAGGTCISTRQKYTCPTNGWISCMPMLSEEGKIACSDEAMQWYKANCPNFQGSAL
jgi:hypothetical protein